MIWRRIQRRTLSTGVTLTVTHGLRMAPELWWIEPVSDRALGRTRVVPGTALTNTINIVNSIQTTATVDLFVMLLKGTLY